MNKTILKAYIGFVESLPHKRRLRSVMPYLMSLPISHRVEFFMSGEDEESFWWIETGDNQVNRKELIAKFTEHLIKDLYDHLNREAHAKGC